MPRKFKTKNGKSTDILHSKEFYGAPYPVRRASAFNPEFISTLSQRDKDLMRGYAQAKVEEMQAYLFKHPDYKSKGRRKSYPTI